MTPNKPAKNLKIHTSSHPKFEIRVIIFSLKQGKLQALLSKDPDHITDSDWQLPGNNIHPNDGLETKAKNTIHSLTNLDEIYLEQLYTYGDTDRNMQERCVSVVYFALIPPDSTSLQFKDAEKVKWFPAQEPPALLFDHQEILEYALRRLRYKLEYSAVGFELLPENFSLSELQKTYEMILGEELDKRNFRRRILASNIIEQTPHQRMGEGRPARLYRYKDDAVAEVKARRLFP